MRLNAGFWSRGYFLDEYRARFRARNAHVAFEEWLGRQEALRAQGLAVDPLYSHYLAFIPGYTP